MTLGNLPRVPVHDIAIQKTANEIVIGTHGRGIYIASIDSIHKAYSAPVNKSAAKDNSTALQLFNWKKMNANEPDIDCPPANPKRKKKSEPWFGEIKKDYWENILNHDLGRLKDV